MVTSNPNQLYQQLAQMPRNQPTAFDAPYQQAVQNFNQATNSQFVLPTVLKSYLGGISPQFTQDKDQVLKQFSDPTSALYISNPFTRMQAAQNAGGVQKQTYGEILGNVQNLMGLGVSQQQQKIKALGDQLSGAQQAQKDQRDALQQQFQNALSIQANNRANSNNGPKPTKDKYSIKYVQGGVDPITGLSNSKVEAGMQFLKNGVAISPAAYALENNLSLTNLLAGSPSKGDQEYAQELAGIERSNDVPRAEKWRQDHPWIFGDITAR